MEQNDSERNDTAGAGIGRGKAQTKRKRLPMLLLAAVGVVIIIVLVVVFTLDSSPNGGGLTVSIDVPAELSAGSDLTVRVKVGELVNFDSAQYDIRYDSDVLEVTGVTNGSLGNTTIPIANWNFDPARVRIINNVPGLVGINGSGYLAEVQFQVIGSSGDASDLEFQGNCVLYNIDAIEILADWVGGSVSVK